MSTFTRDLGHAFELSGVEYAVLLDGENDLDIVVSPASLPLVAPVVARLGQLVQLQDYDLPYSRLFVVRTPGAAGRYRRIDVVCDPWGIGRYGSGPAIALAGAATDADGIRRPRPAALLAYLVAKRAVKGGETAELAGVVAAAGAEGRTLLQRLYGDRVAADPLAALDDVRAAIARAKRRPSALFRRAYHGPRRALSRTLRPTGFVLCLTGPDGVGKSTVTAGLLALRGGPFRASIRLGQRRGFFRKPGALLGRAQGDATRPHDRRPSGRAGSAARLAYMWLDALVGWLPKVAVPRRRTSLVVLERGLLDFAIDPRRYRLSTPPALARMFARLLPQPDLTVVLTASAEQIHARKPELEPSEIDRQLGKWTREAARHPQRFAVVDASDSPERTLELVLDRIDGVLAGRVGDPGAGRAALELVGRPAPGGTRHRVVRRHGVARFVVPAGGGGPLTRGLYRPARRREHVAALGLELAHRARLGGTTPLDQTHGAAPAIATALGLRDVQVAAASSRDDRRGARAVLTVHAGGRLVAYAKAVAAEDAPILERELSALQTLSATATRTLAVPRPLALVSWGRFELLLLEPVELRGRAHRPLGSRELAALAELARVDVVSHRPGEVTVHGDFTAWNTGVARDGRIAIVDWERVGAGLPLEDLFHWRLQELVLFGAGSPELLVAGALEPDEQVRELAARLAVDTDIAAEALLRAATRPEARTSGDDPRDRIYARVHELLGAAT